MDIENIIEGLAFGSGPVSLAQVDLMIEAVNLKKEMKVTTPGPGKFQFNDSLELAEYLHGMVGQEDDFFGDSSSGLGWFGLFTNLTPGSEIVGDSSAHNYIVEETTDGFFNYYKIDTVAEAQAKFEVLRVKFDSPGEDW